MSSDRIVQETLNWGPMVLFLYGMVQSFGGPLLVVAARNRPILLKCAKVGFYLGHAIGFYMLVKVGDATANITDELFPDAGLEVGLLSLSLPLLTYYASALLAMYAYTGLFPKRGRTFVVLMQSDLMKLQRRRNRKSNRWTERRYND